MIPPQELEKLRVAGEKAIFPNDHIKIEIGRTNRSPIIGSFKICVDDTGRVASIKPLRSTGFRSYDAQLIQAISHWAYKPYVDEGRAVPVCTAVTFIYHQA